MKIAVTLSAIALALATTALADEGSDSAIESQVSKDAFVADCEEFKSANGVEGDCDCMADAALEANVAAEIMATETMEDIPVLSAEALAVVEACS